MYLATPISASFGLPELDDVTSGMCPGHLIIVVSAPGQERTRYYFSSSAMPSSGMDAAHA
ncbi:MAG: hypothetical protein ACI38U_06795 [Corynebacterium sp.]|uniref:hypothetical protein n=1 Tax=Corynebacterium sp. TaxID=1720 RepID=UPI003F0B55EE